MARNDIKEEDTFQILLATDCHLGYLERDAVRGLDSLTTFEEILEIAVKEKVDFILLGGDLFHENKPSRKVLHQCMYLLRKYCMGDRAVQFEFLSDQSENFRHSGFPVVNYEDPNLNVSLPVFSIHGNHDDPAGSGSFCSLDLLSIGGLINYFGKCTDLENVQISPLLLQKGSTKLALYGLGSIRDERLHRLFREGKVSMLRPREKIEDWFNMFVLHQNRAKHGATNYIPEQFLDDFLDLVVWGHEHECRIAEEWNSQQSFYVSQPGSSVATSLCHGEAVPKCVGLLQINKKTFKITEIPLKTVRQFYIKDIDLDDTSLNLNEPESSERVMDYCREIVDGLLETAVVEQSGHPKQPKKPLVRLRVYYPVNFETFSVQRFGHSYVDRVANPKDIILFSRKKTEKVLKGSLIDAETLKTVLKQDGFDKSRVEDLVKQYFQRADENRKLSLLSENGVSSAVQEYVDKEVIEAITALVSHQLRKAQNHLKDRQVDDSIIDEEIIKFKEERQKSSVEEMTELQTAIKDCGKKTTQKALDFIELPDDDLEDDSFERNLPKPRGRGRGRGSRGGRGRGAAKTSTLNGSDTNSKSLRGKSSSRSSRSSNRTIDSLFSTNKQQSNSTWKDAPKQSNRKNFDSDSDIETIEVSEDEIRPASKRLKNTTKNSKRGIAYDSDSDCSF